MDKEYVKGKGSGQEQSTHRGAVSNYDILPHILNIVIKYFFLKSRKKHVIFIYMHILLVVHFGHWDSIN